MILSDKFSPQLHTLTSQEQGLVSKAVLELMSDQKSPAFRMHKLDKCKGDWWSASVTMDLRIILKKAQDGELTICWVDHHDAAYSWAQRHIMEAHPVTNKMQLVEIPEVKMDSAVSIATGKKKRQVPLCAQLGLSEKDLLDRGVPELWIKQILDSVSEDELLEIAGHLPADVAEIVLKIAVGEYPVLPEQQEQTRPFESSSEKQTWLVVSDDEDLRAVLSDSWASWMSYLHPSQRAIAEKLYTGPMRVAGSAGTGKTVVALHHARFLIRQKQNGKVLLATFSDNLVRDLNHRCQAFMKPKELERCAVQTLRDFGLGLYDKICPDHPRVLTFDEMRELAKQVIQEHISELPSDIQPAFVVSEWERVVDVRNLQTWEAYRDAVRRGVFKRLGETRRAALWKVFSAIRERLQERNETSAGAMFSELARRFKGHPELYREYAYVIVDESQDLCEVELAFLTAYAMEDDTLFFAGDIGQRVVRYSFPWKPYGIDLRGRTRILKVNYRTTHQIRSVADRLLDSTQQDADEITQDRSGTVSLLTGPKPEIRKYSTQSDEIAGVAGWLNELKSRGLPGNAIAVFVRSENEMERAKAAIAASDYAKGSCRPEISTMFGAKGLEYQAVVVMACDCNVLPSPERLAEADLVAGMQEIYDTERNLLYVACTRPRDALLVTYAGTPSELLLDLEPTK